MRQRHFIDTHKVITGPAVLGMMAWHSSWDHLAAWIYLALHGTYGLLWVCKSRTFPDKSWEERSSVVYGLMIWAGLSLYWIAPWIVTSGSVAPAPWYVAACVALWGFGVFLHFASDMHKNIALQLRPEQLVHTGLWARCRNPNYLGELLIYLGFRAARHALAAAAGDRAVPGGGVDPQHAQKGSLAGALPGVRGLQGA